MKNLKNSALCIQKTFNMILKNGFNPVLDSIPRLTFKGSNIERTIWCKQIITFWVHNNICKSEILNTPIFRLHNIYLVFSTCPHKYKWILCTEKPFFFNFWCSKINNNLICFERKKYMYTYLKAKIPFTQHEFPAFNMYLTSFFQKYTLCWLYSKVYEWKILKKKENEDNKHRGISSLILKVSKLWPKHDRSE